MSTDLSYTWCYDYSKCHEFEGMVVTFGFNCLKSDQTQMTLFLYFLIFMYHNFCSSALVKILLILNSEQKSAWLKKPSPFFNVRLCFSINKEIRKLKMKHKLQASLHRNLSTAFLQSLHGPCSNKHRIVLSSV